MTFQCELTDTFGGEANYSWVNRADIELADNATQRSIVIAAKKALGLTGTRCRKVDFGDMIALYPVNCNMVAFIY